MSNLPTEAVKPVKPGNMQMKFLQAQQPDLQLQYLALQAFWSKIKEEMYGITEDVDPTAQIIPVDFVEGELKLECQGSPELSQLTVNPDASVAMSKVCELFILELTLRAWQGMTDGDRHNLRADDIRRTIQLTDVYDLLVNVAGPIESERKSVSDIMSGQMTLGDK